MKKSLCALSLIFSFSAFAQKDDSLQIRKMFDAALVEGHAYNNLRSLCKDVGARLSGSPEAEKAVKWAKTLLESYEFDKVWLMPVKVPHWVRGDIEKAGVNGKLMNIKTLGGSVSSNGKIEAEVIEEKQPEKPKRVRKARKTKVEKKLKKPLMQTKK